MVAELMELVDHVVGVDPDRDYITVGVVDAKTTGVVAQDQFPATAVGYRAAIEFADAYSQTTERAWAIEGSASYGRGLSGALTAAGEWVIEFDRPTSRTKEGAKSDRLDAVRAAREVLGRTRWNQPRTHLGPREAIRVHASARDGAVRARTAAINELKALIVTVDETIRGELRGLSTTSQVARCARFRDRANSGIEQRCTRTTMRLLAQRIHHLDTEIKHHDQALKTLLDSAAPQLLTERGVGHVTAAAIYIAWSHPGRCRHEAAFARLAGTAPIQATSGQNQTRHRLSRGGDRQLNRALYHIAITRKRCDPDTKTYIARRVAEGKTEREALRCVKRYLARHLWRILEHPPTSP